MSGQRLRQGLGDGRICCPRRNRRGSGRGGTYRIRRARHGSVRRRHRAHGALGSRPRRAFCRFRLARLRGGVGGRGRRRSRCRCGRNRHEIGARAQRRFYVRRRRQRNSRHGRSGERRGVAVARAFGIGAVRIGGSGAIGGERRRRFVSVGRAGVRRRVLRGDGVSVCDTVRRLQCFGRRRHGGSVHRLRVDRTRICTGERVGSNRLLRRRIERGSRPIAGVFPHRDVVRRIECQRGARVRDMRSLVVRLMRIRGFICDDVCRAGLRRLDGCRHIARIDDRLVRA